MSRSAFEDAMQVIGRVVGSQDAALAALRTDLERVEREREAAIMRYRRVSKVNALDPLRKRAVLEMIARRRGLVARDTLEDPRIQRAMVDLLLDLQADIDQGWDW